MKHRHSMIASILGVLCVLTAAQYGGKAIIYSVMGYQYWFKYESVEPAKKVFSDDETLEFVSNADIRRPIQMRWNDILYCKRKGEDDFSYITNYETSIVQTTPKKTIDKKWLYKPNYPGFPATCYLRTEVIGKPPMVSEKIQVLTSQEFKVVELNDK